MVWPLGVLNARYRISPCFKIIHVHVQQLQETIASQPIHTHHQRGRGETVAETEAIGPGQGSETQLWSICTSGLSHIDTCGP